MARVSVTRYGDFLQRVFGLKGSQDQQGVIGDIMPVAPLFDPQGTEHRWPRGEIQWMGIADVAGGGAGTFATVRLTGRAGYVSVVEAMQIGSSVGAAYYAARYEVGVLGGAANVNFIRTDSRAETAAPPPGIQGYQATPGAAVVNSIWGGGIGINAPVIVPLGIIMDADDCLSVGTATANQRMTAIFWGYDRLAEDWERA